MRKLLWLLVVVGCAPVYEPPVLVWDVGDRAAVTTCTLNNQAIVFLHPNVAGTWKQEFILEHEKDHSVDATYFKGGCNAFLRKYADNKSFRIKTEYKAYCKEGRLALKRGVPYQAVWDRIVTALAKDTTLVHDTCL